MDILGSDLGAEYFVQWIRARFMEMEVSNIFDMMGDLFWQSVQPAGAHDRGGHGRWRGHRRAGGRAPGQLVDEQTAWTTWCSRTSSIPASS